MSMSHPLAIAVAILAEHRVAPVIPFIASGYNPQEEIRIVKPSFTVRPLLTGLC